MNMKTRFILFRRGGIYYCEDTLTRKQTSLHTRERSEALALVSARNESCRQSGLNLQLARAYLTASDPAWLERTWQHVMDQIQLQGRDSSRSRYDRALTAKTFDGLRDKKLIETKAEDFLAVLNDGKVSVVHFLRRLHNFALGLGWLAQPVLAPRLWPKSHPKSRRGITLAEHLRILDAEKNAERNLYYQLLWEIGAAQSDAAALTQDNLDWPTETLTYFRMKTGEQSQMAISKKLLAILNQLPTVGPLFPTIAVTTAKDRSAEFCRRCRLLGIKGVSLHSYRYAWAERAKMAGMPERFAQAALGHNSKAVHRAYAKLALVRIPTLEEYEMRNARPAS